jgi:uncharacterized membrane protein YfcA
MIELALLIFIGLLVGFIGGYAGIGGAPFLVAYLVIIMGYTQLSAQGNVLTVMLGPMSLLGVISLWQSIKTQLKNISIGVITYAFFSYYGAYTAFLIGELKMKILFSMLLFIVAVIQLIPLLISKNKNLNFDRTHISSFWVFILGSLIGFLGGLYGIGAGVLFVPLLISIFKMDKDYARGLSLAILLPPVSLGGFIKYNAEGIIEWDIVFILFVSYFFSNYFGAKFGSKSSTSTFQISYAVILILIGAIYFLV